MSRIAESELIINDRGGIYHLDIRPEELGDNVIVVGDPGRVPLVSKYFDAIEYKNQHREFVSHTGRVGNKKVTVLSTGIGPDNIDIVFNELDALANINFDTREINTELKSLNIIRIGTSGSLQESIPVDSFVAGTYGLGLDNLIQFYQKTSTEEETAILNAFKQHTGIDNNLTPYITKSGEKLLAHFQEGYHHGITVTCPGFFGPQGRILRLQLTYPKLVDMMTTFQYEGNFISNFEMETSAIYGLGNLLGHNCLSLNAIIANRIAKTFSKDAASAMNKLITHTLELLSNL
ncbi:nucleoside phosphorylase [Rhizosphaericola mali]|uniref:Uridine phosphorylase n=1 Tax=Rhizosphaericola mali TaxID=2545455 RepID=A0A5P2FXG2_9BACT|nr:nucleoside phosphorylase [Rhizosphaericola mali]QES87885.1 phosphorylase [Rhizosphaericola mali]